MLKLERTCRDGPISVLVRQKEHLFSQTLLLAFALALLLHLGFFLLFHITPIKIALGESAALPINVDVDAVEHAGRVAAYIESEPLTLNGIPLPSPREPLLPALPLLSSKSPTGFLNTHYERANPFEDLESRIYRPEMELPPIAPAQQIRVVVSGLLAAEEMQPHDLPSLDPKAFPTQPARALYEVLVQGATGKVFWYEAKEVTGISTLDAYAEQALRSLAFDSIAAFEIPGLIEIHFYPETSP